MPKLLKNAKEQIIKVAREELRHNENDVFSMRIIAQKCQMAVGTLYNYFPDKLNLIATVLLMDWNVEFQKTKETISSLDSIPDIVGAILKLIKGFQDKNRHIFQSYKDETFGSYYLKLHQQFLGQINELWKLKTKSYRLSEEENLMISEMILIQSKNPQISFTTLCSMITYITEVNHE